MKRAAWMRAEVFIGVVGVLLGFVAGARLAVSGMDMNLAATGEFITALFEAVAWPLGILAVVLIFKEQLRKKIGETKTLDIQGNKVEFEQRVARKVNKANELTEKLGAKPEAVAGVVSTARMPLRAQQTPLRTDECVAKQPKESMIASFEPVKEMILDTAKDKGVVVAPADSVHEILNQLPGQIDEDLVKTVEYLEGARKDAMLLDGPVLQDAARSYVNTAQTLVNALLQPNDPPQRPDTRSTEEPFPEAPRPNGGDPQSTSEPSGSSDETQPGIKSETRTGV